MSSASDPPDLTKEYKTFLRTTSLAMLVIAPVLIALPPRKLDVYTIGLTCAFVASANHLSVDSSGRGIFARMGQFGQPLPQKALEIQEQQQQREKRRRLLEEPIPASASTSGSTRPPTLLQAKAKEIWMGGEQEGWKERRLKDEQEKIAQGEGYGSMIMDQIWEVWNWGEKKGEKLKEEDERVLKDRQREKEFPRIGKEGK